MAEAGGGSSEEFPIDAEMLKVLAADTRRDILRLLGKRRMTLTELAAALDLKKATVLEHLQKLVAVGLVRRHDDERLWVYYELTAQGGRLVSPGKTRFYLVMAGIAAAALLLGSIAAVAILDQAEDHALPLSLRAPPVAGGMPVSLEIILPGGGDGASAWLLTPEDVTRVGGDAPLPRPLTVTPTMDGARLASVDPIPPGDYLLYVRTSAGDNRDNLLPVHLARFEADGPVSAMVGIDAAPRFTVLRDGMVTEGTLRFYAPGQPPVTLSAGPEGTVLETQALDALAPGRYELSFTPRATDAQVPLARAFEVRPPTVALTPLHVAEATPTLLTLSLPGHAGSAPDIRVQGVAVEPTGTNGAYTIQVPPLAPGHADVQVGRIHRTLTVHPDVALAFTLRDDRTLDLHARTPAGTAEADVEVSLDGDRLGATDAQGRLAFTAPADGVHLLRLHTDEGDTVRALRYESESLSEVAPRVRLSNLGHQDGLATTLVSNEGPAPVALTVGTYTDGRLVDSAGIHLVAGASTQVSLNATSPLDVRAEPLRFSAITFSPAGMLPRDVSVRPESFGVSRGEPVATTPAVTVPTAPTDNVVDSRRMPEPQVPMPWGLVLVALAGAALLARRRRR